MVAHKTKNMKTIAKIPTLSELIKDSDMNLKENALMVICNQTPPKEWIKEHPMAKVPYLPIERVEYLLSRIFGKWWVEVLDVKVIANSVSVTVRLFVRNPITGEIDHQDGVGANPIQTDSGKGAMDWNYAKNNGVQLALPAAKTYATKDAAENFGKLFGKDLTRKDVISYEGLLKINPTLEDIKNVVTEKFDLISSELMNDIDRILDTKNNNTNPEVKSFKKIYKTLTEL